MTPPASEGFDRRRLAGLAAAIGAISAVGTSLSLGMPLLAVILEQRGHSGSVIGLVTTAAGVAAGFPAAIRLSAIFPRFLTPIRNTRVPENAARVFQSSSFSSLFR